MTDLDDLPFHYPSEPNPAAVPPRCRRHQWEPRRYLSGPLDVHDGWLCRRCGKVRDEAAVSRSRRSRDRGKAAERAIAERLGGSRVGHAGGPEDVLTGLFAIQSKAGRSYWSERWWDVLSSMPRTDGRIPLLVIGDGGPGRHARRVVVLDERDWIALHGPEETP